VRIPAGRPGAREAVHSPRLDDRALLPSAVRNGCFLLLVLRFEEPGEAGCQTRVLAGLRSGPASLPGGDAMRRAAVAAGWPTGEVLDQLVAPR
jgi:hypothetical protein